VRTKVAVVKLRATAEILMVDAMTFVSLDPDVCDVSLCGVAQQKDSDESVWR
jgi:hypothetical protein